MKMNFFTIWQTHCWLLVDICCQIKHLATQLITKGYCNGKKLTLSKICWHVSKQPSFSLKFPQQLIASVTSDPPESIHSPQNHVGSSLPCWRCVTPMRSRWIVPKFPACNLNHYASNHDCYNIFANEDHAISRERPIHLVAYSSVQIDLL